MAEYISREQAIKYLCTNMNWYDEEGYRTDNSEKVSAITDLINMVVNPSYSKILNFFN